jgi:hypothetical protein
MKVFYDTEFIEGYRDERHFIDLISIGIVKESGEEFFAYSKEYDYEEASDWVKEHVIEPLYIKADLAAVNYINVTNFHRYAGKSLKEIAKGIKKFLSEDNITLYGYYSSYDHVVLSTIFGTMLDLPDNFPMYTRDIMQIIEGQELDKDQILRDVPQVDEHDALEDAKWNKDAYFYIKDMLTKK